MSRNCARLTCLLALALFSTAHSFTFSTRTKIRPNSLPSAVNRQQQPFGITVLHVSTNGENQAVSDASAAVLESPAPNVTQLKTNLLRACQEQPLPKATIASLIRQLEATTSQAPIEMELLSGDWELVYASDDATRSSPFFWAFQKAFPDTCDQVFAVTDGIPLKDIGPAYQTISYDPIAKTGRLVSRVKVSTLGGLATSIMTTRASITRVDAENDLVLNIETTKPERSSLLNTLLGPLGPLVDENAPAFPSGATLERVMPGSSTVTMQTSYLDEGLRVSKNKERPDSQVFVWRRKEFASYEYL
ncbi:hypothetical protein MPSEU_000395400 [Mayamaea pseudoterrestris]|nr:hypothetical protein MPSEU_000395400 [Mayamaea pseudoterrestris]